jgi:hypothetical protein
MPTDRKVCSCCDRYAGHFQQWHNRDIGFGICADCIAWLRAPREGKPPRCDEAEIRDLYGIEGVHFAKAERQPQVVDYVDSLAWFAKYSDAAADPAQSARARAIYAQLAAEQQANAIGLASKPESRFS